LNNATNGIIILSLSNQEKDKPRTMNVLKKLMKHSPEDSFDLVKSKKASGLELAIPESYST